MGTTVDDTRVRELLHHDRNGTQRRIEALSRDFDDVVTAQADVATDDEHDPEGATIAFERSRVAALLEQAHDHLVDIDRALERLDDGKYGICESCGADIAPARLEARPVALTCIGCAAQRR